MDPATLALIGAALLAAYGIRRGSRRPSATPAAEPEPAPAPPPLAAGRGLRPAVTQSEADQTAAELGEQVPEDEEPRTTRNSLLRAQAAVESSPAADVVGTTKSTPTSAPAPSSTSATAIRTGSYVAGGSRTGGASGPFSRDPRRR